ncbi:MAG: hypothetical protein J6K21_05565 [Bacilli bacterium]|nr:hypothetical protein [Bacilli bacterium]
MIVNAEIINEIQNYLDRFIGLRKEFANGFLEIKNQYTNKIINNIIDKMHESKTFVIPSDLDLKEKIDYYLDNIINDYYNEITSFMNFNNRVLTDFVEERENNTYNVDFQNIVEILYDKKINYSEEQDIEQIINKTVDTIISHIGFRNQYNTEYYKNSRELETFVRNEVYNNIEKLNKDMTELYNYTVESINNMKNNFVEQSANYYQNEIQNNNVPKEGDLTAILDNNSQILTDDLESENAKKFI